MRSFPRSAGLRHHVVRTDGSLAGYRWGVERKARLLARENAGKEWFIADPLNHRKKQVSLS